MTIKSLRGQVWTAEEEWGQNRRTGEKETVEDVSDQFKQGMSDRLVRRQRRTGEDGGR